MPAKLSILFPFERAPGGGGSRFLTALRQELRTRDRYADHPGEADALLFNSHHVPEQVLAARRRYPDKVFLQRVDGPMQLYNHSGDQRDHVVHAANALLADATVFQSEWSRRENRSRGFPVGKRETVIINAPDHQWFRSRTTRPPGRPVRVVAVSWSDNSNKGFDVYRWLDEHLDPALALMTFIGRSPVKFGRIRQLPTLAVAELAGELRSHDIFLTASRKDPCSNALLEALSCGLPSIVRRDGGHPELVGAGGECFDRAEEIPALIERIVADHAAYCSRIRIPSMTDTAERYLAFAEACIAARQAGDLPVRSLSPADVLKFRGTLAYRRLRERAAAWTGKFSPKPESEVPS